MLTKDIKAIIVETEEKEPVTIAVITEESVTSKVIPPYVESAMCDIKEFIDNAPTIEAEPVRRGEWIATEDPWFRACSVCGYLEYDCLVNNYCPECGTKMDGGAERSE